MQIFRAPSTAASIRRAGSASFTLLAFSFSLSAHADHRRVVRGQVVGNKPWRATYTWKSTEIRAISTSAWSAVAGAACGSFAMRADQCHTEEGAASSACKAMALESVTQGRDNSGISQFNYNSILLCIQPVITIFTSCSQTLGKFGKYLWPISNKNKYFILFSANFAMFINPILSQVPIVNKSRCIHPIILNIFLLSNCFLISQVSFFREGCWRNIIT